MNIHVLKGTRSGRLYVVGNGPSLLTHGELLKNLYPTFCCNRFFAWKQNYFVPTYYMVNASKLRGEGLEPALRAPDDPPVTEEKFVARSFIDGLKMFTGWIDVAKSNDIDIFGNYFNSIYHCPGMMALQSIQVGFWLGYREFYILGCELSPKGQVFNPDESRTGWEMTPTDRFTSKYVLGELTEHGARITDCTPDGLLTVMSILDYKPLEEVLAVHVS